MRRGQKKLFIFELMILIVLVLNSFVWNILSSYKISIFLLVILLIFKAAFGLEKDKQRYWKDLMLEVIIFLVAFFILYYLLGIIISFYKTKNYYTFEGITEFIIPTILYVTLREYLRFNFMRKSEGSRLLFIMAIIIFTLFDITTAIYVTKFSSSYNIFIFIALTLLPSLSLNMVFSYFVLKTGYKPLLLYSIITNLYVYLLPIVPNPNEYIASVIEFVLPITLGYRFHTLLKKTDKKTIGKEYRQKNYIPIMTALLAIVVLVYFTSGYFHYWTIAVASGSMEPHISKGDVAVIEKIDKQYDTLKKGQVIAFKYNNVVVVHRLVNIVEEKGEYFFYTKGDANADPDNFVIRQKEVIGIVNHKIPFIGIPTVLLNEM